VANSSSTGTAGRALLWLAIAPAGCRSDRAPSGSADAVPGRVPASLEVPRGAPLATVGGVTINQGGFGSALAIDPGDPAVFYLLTDRGPNTPIDCADLSVVALAVPTFTPRIGRFRRTGDGLVLEREILLTRADGTPLTGIPHPRPEANRTERPVRLDCGPLVPDSLGIDSEGLTVSPDGSFWVSDEYGPDVIHFGADGRTIERFTPGDGLPRVLARRRLNRGMEGIAVLNDGSVAALMQSPLDNPAAGTGSAGRTSRLARLVVIDPTERRTRQYAYLVDSPDTFTSDLVALGPDSFLVLEHDATFQASGPSVKKIYRFDIGEATDISDPADDPGGHLVDGKTLEELTSDAARTDSVLTARGIKAGTKTLVVDLVRMFPDYPHNKIEGLAIVDEHTLAISNDDDFGVTEDGAGRFRAKILPGTGAQDFNSIRFVRLPAPLRR
jgi:hypothetical protein